MIAAFFGRTLSALKLPTFAPRTVLASNDAWTIAHEILAMGDEQVRVGFSARR